MKEKPSQDEDKPWYHEGLRFKCTGCGKCCGGAPGYVWLTESDIKRLASHLDISEKELLNQHCRNVGGKYSLKEQSITYNCIFLKDKKCSVYEGRPNQCRTYPFWGKILKSKKTWNYEVYECEGIEHEDAPLIPLSTIREKLRQNDE